MVQISLFPTNKLLKTYDTIRTSFWFVPCLIIFATLLLCSSLLWVDKNLHLQDIHWLNFLYHADGSITRDLLTTVAGSVMTVVSITFSITMVALTNASSQFGPRLIRNFMNDPSTQSVLGVFTSIFLYCLVLARATDNFAGGEYLPGLTLGGAILLTFSGILLLIYFIHHVAINLQADNVIDKVFETMQTNILHIFDEQRSNEAKNTSCKSIERPLKSAFTPIHIKRSGYVQAINYTSLTQILSSYDQCAELLITPGDYITSRMVVIHHSGDDPSPSQIESLLSCITLGAKRTPIQDPEFAILQLVEIALRALSPSINDPYSAIVCVDKLSTTLCNLLHKEFPQGIACDNEDKPRLIFKKASFESLANSAYDQIRQHANRSLSVQLRLLEGLCRIAEQAQNQKHWKFIRQQKNMLEHELKKRDFVDHDMQEINERITCLEHIMAKRSL
ncbi:hypothetical protein MGA5115_02004 [Marinomonas gallaica]|uniref:DUF2254 domain-containing protein n=1 Tax=Marinomonas gallaica TaxID=1806667 RepID=A0A1C3JRN4_9GAMM|nr:DUF2254 domain-containing protein [Marinomonas gallaica]SBT17888.1 hypothetical protein MGA5115_02004 [Marinomonas gallaica]SBT22026.1 hypothetical protein MGA5116_02637 [Marinomonas gallaica]